MSLPTWIYGGGLSESAHTISVAGLSALTLGPDQALRRAQTFTGALTSNCTVTFPLDRLDGGLIWTITNSTSGAFTLAVAGPSGASYNIPQGRRTAVLWDGTNMIPAEFGAVVRSDESIVSGITGASPTVVLTTAQANASVITLQGDATGSPVIQMPNGFALFVINNQLGVGVTVKTAGGNATGTISSSSNKWVFIDNNPNGGNANTV